MRLVSAKEAQLNLEANLPNSVKEMLGLPTTPLAELKEEMMKPSEYTSDLITTARATSKKKRLGVGARGYPHSQNHFLSIFRIPPVAAQAPIVSCVNLMLIQDLTIRT